MKLLHRADADLLPAPNPTPSLVNWGTRNACVVSDTRVFILLNNMFTIVDVDNVHHFYVCVDLVGALLQKLEKE